MSSYALDSKKALYKDASSQVKNGLLTTGEVEEKRQTVFSLYVGAMNDLESWTGKGSRLLVTQHWETNFLQSTGFHSIGHEHMSIQYNQRRSRHTVFLKDLQTAGGMIKQQSKGGLSSIPCHSLSYSNKYDDLIKTLFVSVYFTLSCSSEIE